VQSFNSIFPKVCKNDFRTFVIGTLDKLYRNILMKSVSLYLVQFQTYDAFSNVQLFLAPPVKTYCCAE